MECMLTGAQVTEIARHFLTVVGLIAIAWIIARALPAFRKDDP